MRITKLEAILLRPRGTIDTAIADGSQDGLLVRIHTDDGLVGLGEVDSQPSPRRSSRPLLHKLCNGLAALLIENPLEIGRLWQKMYKGSLYYGRRGAAIHAISGVEIALWDIAGKAAGKPIHALLGGARRDKVKAYASTLMPDKPKDAARAVETQMKAGFKAVKLGWGPLGQPQLDVAYGRRTQGWRRRPRSHDRCRQGLRRRATARPRAADGGIQPLLIEEPFGLTTTRNMRPSLRPSARPSPAAEETTLADFERLVEAGNVEIPQPDDPGRRHQRMPARCRLCPAPGQALRAVCLSTGIKAATLQVLAMMEEAEYMEYCVQTTDLNQRLV
jgi:L-alanine-DL-glutamate epimerase-like enolase superfamily enzyme